MKVSGFILDVDSGDVLAKCRRWARDGLLRDITIQIDDWPHAEKNRAAFGAWQSEFHPLGVRVGGMFWIVPPAALMVEKIERLRTLVAPDYWHLDIEDPYEGEDTGPLMRVTKPQPVKVTYNGLAEQQGFDFRHLSYRGAEIATQCYGPNGEQPWNGNYPYPVQAIRSAFKPKICWLSSPGSNAWWYRAHINDRWTWLRLYQNDSRYIYAIGTSGGTYRIRKNENVQGHLEFHESREVFSGFGTPAVVGHVHGFATYPKIGYSLSVEREATPDALMQLAREAKFESGRVCKLVDIYTLENCSDAQFRAVAGAA